MRSAQTQNKEQLRGLSHWITRVRVILILRIENEWQETDLPLVLWALCHTGLTACWALGRWTHHGGVDVRPLFLSLSFGRFWQLQLLLNRLRFRNHSFCRLDVDVAVLSFCRKLCILAARFWTWRLRLYAWRQASLVVEVTWLVLSGVAVH